RAGARQAERSPPPGRCRADLEEAGRPARWRRWLLPEFAIVAAPAVLAVGAAPFAGFPRAAAIVISSKDPVGAEAQEGPDITAIGEIPDRVDAGQAKAEPSNPGERRRPQMAAPS